VDKENFRKIAEELMKIPGNTKGSEFLTLKDYIFQKYGKEGVEKFEKEMEKLGYPISFDKIRPAHWYSEALNVLSYLVAKELFGWPDLFEIGYNSPVFSFGVKVFVKFLPLSLFLKQIPNIWKKFMDFGSLEVSEYNEKENCIILNLKGYKFHPLMCSYYKGFFLRMAEFLVKSEKIEIEEKKCIYKGDSYHQWEIKWK
jgi:hypothetical protein